MPEPTNRERLEGLETRVSTVETNLGVTITNCPQILDGFTWRNVVFINSHISYKGGPVILDNVTFLNCTFQTERNDEGIRLLQYAALDENNLQVKPEFFKPS